MKVDYVARFKLVVDLLRARGNYTATLLLGTVYTIVSDTETRLSVDDYLTLNTVSVRVVSIVDAKTFTVDFGEESVPLTGIWKAKAPYDIIGTRKTINLMMHQRNSGELQYQKYPLIALRLPVTRSVKNGISTFPANILIATFTNKTLTPDQRMVQTFRPKLYPLRDRFLKMVVRSGYFLGFNKDYDDIDRMFYGTESGDVQNIKNVFDDPLDAIELLRLQLSYLEDECPDAGALSELELEEYGFEYGFEKVLEE